MDAPDSGDQAENAAILIAMLPADLATRLTASLDAAKSARLAEAFRAYAGSSPRERQAAWLQLAMAMQSRTGIVPTRLNRTGALELCRAHPAEAEALITEWVGPGYTPVCPECKQSFSCEADLRQHQEMGDQNLTLERQAALVLVAIGVPANIPILNKLGTDVSRATAEIPHLRSVSCHARLKTLVSFMARCQDKGAGTLVERLRALVERDLDRVLQQLRTMLQLADAEPHPDEPDTVTLRFDAQLNELFKSKTWAERARTMLDELLAAGWPKPFKLRWLATGKRGTRITVTSPFGQSNQVRIAAGTADQRIDAVLQASLEGLAVVVRPAAAGAGELSEGARSALSTLRTSLPMGGLATLGRLGAGELQAFVSGIVECLKLPQERLMGLFAEALAEGSDAGERPRAATVADLVLLFPDFKPVLSELSPRLSGSAALALAERLARNVVLGQLGPITAPRRFLAAGEIIDWWRSRRSAAPGHVGDEPAAVAARIQSLWPHLTTAANLASVLQMAAEQPGQMAVILARFVNESGSEPWYPGPVRAGQFLHSLNDPEPVRALLLKQGYPITPSSLSLPVLRLARGQWAATSASRP